MINQERLSFVQFILNDYLMNCMIIYKKSNLLSNVL